MRNLYVHVPFCRSRCSYCDFAIQVGRVNEEDYLRGLSAELTAKRYTQSEPIDTVFFGGGTPSLLSADGVGSVIEMLGATAASEVTLEANPEDITLERCDEYATVGVNRISIGVQSLDDAVLGYFGRNHSAAQGMEAVLQARASAIASVSVDVIFGAPIEDMASWTRTLEGVLGCDVDHVSAYGLTVETATVLGVAGVIVPDTVAALRYERASEVLEGQAYRWYEISNWARAGFESRHNWNYWMHGDYLGVGPGAHSKADRERSWNVASYPRYMMRVSSGLDPTDGVERLSNDAIALEHWYLGLRTRVGVATDRRVPEWARGFIEVREGRWTLTSRGRMQTDAVVTRLGRDGVF
ncbi:MAG: radical SAM family heme chaperone HemW [Ferrimicrobium sp.]